MYLLERQATVSFLVSVKLREITPIKLTNSLAVVNGQRPRYVISGESVELRQITPTQLTNSIAVFNFNNAPSSRNGQTQAVWFDRTS
jgi:hypothetical protein